MKAPEAVKPAESEPASETAKPAAEPQKPAEEKEKPSTEPQKQAVEQMKTAPEAAKPVREKVPQVAKTPVPEAPKPEPEKPKATTVPVEKKERIVEEKFFLMARETTMYPDGSVSDVSTFTYDVETLQLLKKEMVDSHKIALETTTYEYTEGRLIRVTVRDGGGRMKSQRVSTFTPEGFLETETLSGRDGKIASLSRFQYDAQGNRTLWSVFDGAKVLLGTTTYVFQGGRNVRMDISNAAGRQERTVFLEYDGGRRVKESYRLPSGETEKYTVYAWKDGRLVSESVFRAADQPVSRVEYAYDDDGNVRSVLTYDRTGALTQTRNREYAERIVTHVVRE